MIKNKEELFEDDEDLDIQEYKGKDDVMLKTHENINQDLCGEIEKLDSGFVKLKLVTTHDMIADSQNLIHGGFIFSAADYAAMAAVNEKNVVLVASECQFLSPVKFGDIVNFIAKVRHKEGRKRNIHVTGYVLEIKVFEGEFKTVVTDRHVLKLKLTDTEGIVE
ncbi:MAG: hotdog domain-containing protein [Sulfurimonas sp.]|jgi:acyl-CoA thioesterase|uniref:hotdog domain-containing protein n=1 Tax=unclassified Sulfurimonas TaxID=2623549 RepID=UPI0008B6C53A|nr:MULTISPECIES: hotdog domain-containing protein [unclassified Sulfurimonas]MBS4068506.1 PaaI family thioesterase [Sulfurimonas sp.]MDD3854942.1 hotdog domain-containing protein [Sulfurimonas sp.]OHE04433.1 MAG: thioesterase [Sulfurimonas sp. RIFOXYB12_FULL_35_9]OHE12446.1 MAG: thioesterase [Sulfurimonas sp. RIFOXYB2_FULL_37_5]